MSDQYPRPRFDRGNPYHAAAECALLGLYEHPQDRQLASFASGCESWEAFAMALDFTCILGFATDQNGTYTITAHGRRRLRSALAREVADSAAGRLTRREASAAHADLIYQHTLGPTHPLAVKLWAIMSGEHRSLSAAEAQLLADHVAVQSGPMRGRLIDKLAHMGR